VASTSPRKRRPAGRRPSWARSFTGLIDATWMSYGWPAPSGDLWMGLYLDDVLLVYIESCAAAFRVPRPLSERADLVELRRLRLAHQAASTVLHEAKRVEAAQRGVFWGAEFLENHVITGETHHLVALTLAALRAAFGWSELRQLVSTWTHHLIFRRSTFWVSGDFYEGLPV
jgi:hypothetical protein